MAYASHANVSLVSLPLTRLSGPQLCSPALSRPAAVSQPAEWGKYCILSLFSPFLSVLLKKGGHKYCRFIN